jgi:hypothetical protein
MGGASANADTTCSRARAAADGLPGPEGKGGREDGLPRLQGGGGLVDGLPTREGAEFELLLVPSKLCVVSSGAKKPEVLVSRGAKKLELLLVLDAPRLSSIVLIDLPGAREPTHPEVSVGRGRRLML